MYRAPAPEFWLEVPTGSKDEEATEGNGQAEDAEDAEDAQASEVPSCLFLHGCGRVKYGQNTQADIKPVVSIVEFGKYHQDSKDLPVVSASLGRKFQREKS